MSRDDYPPVVQYGGEAVTTIKDRLRDAAQRIKDIGCLNEAALMLEVAGINERLERDKEAIMQGQADLRAHIVAMREILGAEKGEDTIDACRRVVADRAKARSDALEEAAKACEKFVAGEISGQTDNYPGEISEAGLCYEQCADEIRALKEKP